MNRHGATVGVAISLLAIVGAGLLPADRPTNDAKAIDVARWSVETLGKEPPASGTVADRIVDAIATGLDDPVAVAAFVDASNRSTIATMRIDGAMSTALVGRPGLIAPDSLRLVRTAGEKFVIVGVKARDPRSLAWWTINPGTELEDLVRPPDGVAKLPSVPSEVFLVPFRGAALLVSEHSGRSRGRIARFCVLDGSRCRQLGSVEMPLLAAVKVIANRQGRAVWVVAVPRDSCEVSAAAIGFDGRVTQASIRLGGRAFERCGQIIDFAGDVIAGSQQLLLGSTTTGPSGYQYSTAVAVDRRGQMSDTLTISGSHLREVVTRSSDEDGQVHLYLVYENFNNSDPQLTEYTLGTIESASSLVAIDDAVRLGSGTLIVTEDQCFVRNLRRVDLLPDGGFAWCGNALMWQRSDDNDVVLNNTDDLVFNYGGQHPAESWSVQPTDEGLSVVRGDRLIDLVEGDVPLVRREAHAEEPIIGPDGDVYAYNVFSGGSVDSLARDGYPPPTQRTARRSAFSLNSQVVRPWFAGRWAVSEIVEQTSSSHDVGLWITDIVTGQGFALALAGDEHIVGVCARDAVGVAFVADGRRARAIFARADEERATVAVDTNSIDVSDAPAVGGCVLDEHHQTGVLVAQRRPGPPALAVRFLGATERSIPTVLPRCWSDLSSAPMPDGGLGLAFTDACGPPSGTALVLLSGSGSVRRSIRLRGDVLPDTLRFSASSCELGGIGTTRVDDNRWYFLAQICDLDGKNRLMIGGVQQQPR